MRISNNLPSMNTGRQLRKGERKASASTEKLSSGYRINRAGDDAAGLAISEKMRAQIRGLKMASKNSQDGISLIQTAEGALQDSQNILQRMRELAVQSSNDTNETAIDRAALDAEFQELKAELDSTAQTTTFNDGKLLDGSLSRGATAGNAITSIIQTSPGTAVVSANGSVAEGDYTILASYTAKGSVYTGATEPIITMNGGLTDTATHGITLTGIQISSTNGPEDWLGFDLNGLISDFISSYDDLVYSMRLVLNTFKYSPEATTFPMTIVPVTINNSNNEINFEVTGTPYLQTLTLEDGTYTTAQELADEINRAVLRYNDDNGTTYQPAAFVDGDGRMAWDESEMLFYGDSTLLRHYFSTGQMYDDANALYLQSPYTTADLNSTNKMVFTDGTRSITMTFSGTVNSGFDVGDVAMNIIDSLKENAIVSATYSQEVFDPPKAYYEIDINGEKAKVFDGQSSVSVGGVTLDFGGPVSVDEASGDASDLDALLGDGLFSISRTEGEPTMGNALVLQTGANKGDTLAINIEAMSAEALGVDGSDIASGLSARDAIGACDKAINMVSSERAHLGAMHNRLAHKTQNLDNSAENLSAAESRIRDVDMAKEMAELTKHNVITQAATSMLAQTNSQPQNVIKLLG